MTMATRGSSTRPFAAEVLALPEHHFDHPARARTDVDPE